MLAKRSFFTLHRKTLEVPGFATFTGSGSGELHLGKARAKKVRLGIKGTILLMTRWLWLYSIQAVVQPSPLRYLDAFPSSALWSSVPMGRSFRAEETSSARGVAATTEIYFDSPFNFTHDDGR